MLIVNFGTGAGNYKSKKGLGDLIEEVQLNATYTQMDIEILNDEQEVIAYLPWYGVGAEDEDVAIVDFGTYGFYGEWVII